MSTLTLSFISANFPIGLNFSEVLSNSTLGWAGGPLCLRPFDALSNEKISLDFGPWMKQICNKFPSQVRIRVRRESEHSRALYEVVRSSVKLIQKITQSKGLPNLSHWHLVELRQKDNKKATFNCIFTVQGHTRLILSHEGDVCCALCELLPTNPVDPALLFSNVTDTSAQLGGCCIAPSIFSLPQQYSTPEMYYYRRSVDRPWSLTASNLEDHLLAPQPESGQRIEYGRYQAGWLFS